MDAEVMEDLIIYNKRERHWRMGFKDNEEGVDDEKMILHYKRWYIYMDEKRSLIKCGYSMEVSGFDRKKVIWGVVDNHVVD